MTSAAVLFLLAVFLNYLYIQKNKLFKNKIGICFKNISNIILLFKKLQI